MEGRHLNWTKKNRRTVIIAACVTVLFVVWLWGFTHRGPAPQQPEVSREQPAQSQEEPEQPEQSRYLPSAEEAQSESGKSPEKPQPVPKEPEKAPAEPEPLPVEPEPLPEEPSEKDVPAKEDVPDWESGWKEPDWPEWPEWSERQTIPRRTVTGTVGSVPRRDG